MQTEPPKRKRRWFQFSLRSLMIVVTITAVESAVCLSMVREWRQRREDMRLLEDAIHRFGTVGHTFTTNSDDSCRLKIADTNLLRPPRVKE
jgi:hypothetical protein